MKLAASGIRVPANEVSVLSVEPWGMKLSCANELVRAQMVSVLSVEPWGMKLEWIGEDLAVTVSFSALGRAVGDET